MELRKDFIGWDDNGIMPYTTDLKNVYFHLSEYCERSVFSNFIACCSCLYQPHCELLSPE